MYYLFFLFFFVFFFCMEGLNKFGKGCVKCVKLGEKLWNSNMVLGCSFLGWTQSFSPHLVCVCVCVCVICMYTFGLVLWHITHCRLFNAESFLYIYIEYLTSKHILWITSLNKAFFFFFCITLNDFIYFYLIRIILFAINYLFAHSSMFTNIAV